MDSNGSDVSQPDSYKFVVLDSQEESPFPVSGERTLLSTLPGLQMENTGASVSGAQGVSTSEDRQKTGSGDNLLDDEEEDSPPARIAVIHVTDTGSEAEPGKIPPSQRPPIIVADTETQSDTDGGVIGDVAVAGSTSDPPLDGSSDDPDKTIKAPLVVDVSEAEKTLQGEQDSSGKSSGKYVLGSGVEWELSHTQGAHLTSKPRGHGSPAVGTQGDAKPMHSPKDLFTAEDSDEEDKPGALTPSEHLSSLQVSQPLALVPETLDNDSLEDVPPSVEAYGSIPVIIPSSPTAQDSESSEEEKGSYRPEELSTLDPDTKHKRPVGSSTSGSGSSSRSGKQSVESESKSNGNNRESIKAWQPSTLLSDVGSAEQQPASSEKTSGETTQAKALGRRKFDIDIEASEQLHIRSSSSKFLPSLSEANSENSDFLALKLSHSEEDKSNSAHRSQDKFPEEDMDVDEEHGYLDSQHIALRLSPSQPDSAGKEVKPGAKGQKSGSSHKPSSWPEKSRGSTGHLSSSDPSGAKQLKTQGVVSLFAPRGPGRVGIDVDVPSPKSPISSTPEEKVEEDVERAASVFKPSLSLSMIDDPEGEDEDSGLQSFRLNRPVVHFPETSIKPETESLFRKGVSPQKKRKRSLYKDRTDDEQDDPFSFTPRSQDKPPKRKRQAESEEDIRGMNETVKGSSHKPGIWPAGSHEASERGSCDIVEEGYHEAGERGSHEGVERGSHEAVVEGSHESVEGRPQEFVEERSHQEKVFSQQEIKENPKDEAVVMQPEEDLDVTIPPESLSFKEQHRSAEVSVSLSEPAASDRSKFEASRADDGNQETILYDVETYTGIKVKPERETTPLSSRTSHTPSQSSAKHQSKLSLGEATLMSSHTESTLVSPSQSSAKHQSKQSADLYDFHSTQSQAAGGAIKNPNSTPVLMPKSTFKASTGKKKRKKVVSSARQTRVRGGNVRSEVSAAASLSSSEEADKTPARGESRRFDTQTATVRRNPHARRLQEKKKVRLSVAGKTEEPGCEMEEPVPSTSTAATAAPSQHPLNVSEGGSGGGSQPGVRWKKIVTTKTRILYEKRLITIEERKDGKVVFCETREENEEPVVEWKSVTTHEEEDYLSPGPSPSRSGSTVTSGDLGDVSSSLSRSGSHGSKTSSSGSFDRMHSSLERMSSSGPSSREEPKHEEIRSKPQTTTTEADHQPAANQTGESRLKNRLSRDGSDVLFTSSDMDDSSKHGHKDLDVSHMELSPIVDEAPPPMEAPEKQAADSSEDNRISGGKTQNVTISPDVSSSSMGDRQVSGGFTVLEQGISEEEERRESDNQTRSGILKSGQKSKLSRSTSYHSSSSSKDLPLKKRKVIDIGDSHKKGASPRKCKGRMKFDTSGNSDDISPEFPVVGKVEPASGLQGTEYRRVTADSVSSQKGALVTAKWRDGYFYPGTLVEPRPDDRCLVDFADGDHLAVRLCDVIIVDRFCIGQSVLVESSDGGYDPGLVIGYYGRGTNSGYTVETDDGVTHRYMRSKVILSADQAMCILGESHAPVTPGPSHSTTTADVSLDNLVEGKRRTRSTAAPATKGKGPASKKSRSTAKSSKTAAKSSKAAVKISKSAAKGSKSTGSGIKRKLPTFEPSQTSTPTPTQSGRKTRLVTVASPAPKQLGGAVDSPKTLSRSSRRVRTELFDDAKGPLPTDQYMFDGMVFLLTHVDKTLEQRREERHLLIESSFEGSTDESAIEEEVVVPFDKEHLKAQITTGGGVLLEKFDLNQLSRAGACFLISDSYQRTVKYLLCLAAGVTCVSHVWIRDSCKQGKLLDPGSYMLPAGLNIEARKIMECSKRNSLAGLAVSVVSLSADFRDAWVSILQTAGCVVTSQLSSEVTVDKDLGVVVTDSTCPKSFIIKSETVGVPVVSTEWVIQCLIRGEFVDTKSHPRYQPHYYDR